MSMPDTLNPLFEMAARFVNQTNRHLFLTGKAGTGKTTFLRYIRENSFKKMAVVAPTGVAAINAGGVTMHSFFQLPFGAFIPVQRSGWNSNSQFVTPNSLFKNLKLNRDKRQLMQELELLVIDEVSMLRADLLDEIDIILRHVRRQPLTPFGGVQMLYIGDLFQLPPVVNHEEWQVLSEYYKSPFFFDAQILQQSPPLYLELKKIYRQHETDFINLLNNIRNNEATDSDLKRLHQHYRPGYEPKEEENYITLTTHNAKADTINQTQLNRLPGKLYEFGAEFSGEFNEKALPADRTLQLKEGAQVMFIKNDKGENRKYYNGKIATIARIAEDNIFVKFTGEEHELKLEKETWKHIRYSYNNEEDEIEEEELGTFKQFPIRLAWAITIHKSQGLTFEKAIIDAGASFAPGQVYVALSRLISLDGLILLSRIQPDCINTDSKVLEFTRSEQSEDILQQELQQEQKVFLVRSLLQSFDWTKLAEGISVHYDEYAHRTIPDKNECIAWGKKLLDDILQQQEMAQKFVRQLEQLLPGAENDNYQFLHQRVTAASDYFNKAIDVTINAIQTHINEVKIKPRIKKYITTLRTLLLLPQRKKQQLQQAVHMTEGLIKGVNAADLLQQVEEQKKQAHTEAEIIVEKKAPKPAKGETMRISLQMFKEGKAIADIAQQRSLALSTIESHLAGFVSTGELDIKELVAEEKIAAIMQVLDEQDTESYAASPAKEKLGDDYSFGEIRAVINYRSWLKQESEVEE